MPTCTGHGLKNYVTTINWGKPKKGSEKNAQLHENDDSKSDITTQSLPNKYDYSKNTKKVPKNFVKNSLDRNFHNGSTNNSSNKDKKNYNLHSKTPNFINSTINGRKQNKGSENNNAQLHENDDSKSDITTRSAPNKYDYSKLSKRVPIFFGENSLDRIFHSGSKSNTNYEDKKIYNLHIDTPNFTNSDRLDPLTIKKAKSDAKIIEKKKTSNKEIRRKLFTEPLLRRPLKLYKINSDLFPNTVDSSDLKHKKNPESNEINSSFTFTRSGYISEPENSDHEIIFNGKPNKKPESDNRVPVRINNEQVLTEDINHAPNFNDDNDLELSSRSSKSYTNELIERKKLKNGNNGIPKIPFINKNKQILTKYINDVPVFNDDNDNDSVSTSRNSKTSKSGLMERKIVKRENNAISKKLFNNKNQPVFAEDINHVPDSIDDNDLESTSRNYKTTKSGLMERKIVKNGNNAISKIPFINKNKQPFTEDINHAPNYNDDSDIELTSRSSKSYKSGLIERKKLKNGNNVISKIPFINKNKQVFSKDINHVPDSIDDNDLESTSGNPKITKSGLMERRIVKHENNAISKIPFINSTNELSIDIREFKQNEDINTPNNFVVSQKGKNHSKKSFISSLFINNDDNRAHFKNYSFNTAIRNTENISPYPTNHKYIKEKTDKQLNDSDDAIIETIERNNVHDSLPYLLKNSENSKQNYLTDANLILEIKSDQNTEHNKSIDFNKSSLLKNNSKPLRNNSSSKVISYSDTDEDDNNSYDFKKKNGNLNHIEKSPVFTKKQKTVKEIAIQTDNRIHSRPFLVSNGSRNKPYADYINSSENESFLNSDTESIDDQNSFIGTSHKFNNHHSIKPLARAGGDIENMNTDINEDIIDDERLKIKKYNDLKFYVKPRTNPKNVAENSDDINENDEEKLRELIKKVMKPKGKSNNGQSKVAQKNSKVRKTTNVTTTDKGYTIYLDKSGVGGGMNSDGQHTHTGGILKNMSTNNFKNNQNSNEQGNNISNYNQNFENSTNGYFDQSKSLGFRDNTDGFDNSNKDNFNEYYNPNNIQNQLSNNQFSNNQSNMDQVNGPRNYLNNQNSNGNQNNMDQVNGPRNYLNNNQKSNGNQNNMDLVNGSRNYLNSNQTNNGNLNNMDQVNGSRNYSNNGNQNNMNGKKNVSFGNDSSGLANNYLGSNFQAKYDTSDPSYDPSSYRGQFGQEGENKLNLPNNNGFIENNYRSNHLNPLSLQNNSSNPYFPKTVEQATIATQTITEQQTQTETIKETFETQTDISFGTRNLLLVGSQKHNEILDKNQSFDQNSVDIGNEKISLPQLSRQLKNFQIPMEYVGNKKSIRLIVRSPKTKYINADRLAHMKNFESVTERNRFNPNLYELDKNVYQTNMANEGSDANYRINKLVKIKKRRNRERETDNYN